MLPRRLPVLSRPLLLLSLAAVIAGSIPPVEAARVGRVKVTEVPFPAAERLEAAKGRFLARLGETAPATRLISFSFSPVADRYDVRVWDEAALQGWDLVVDAEGKELSRRAASGEIRLAPGEFDEAMAVLAKTAEGAAKLATPYCSAYEPMPAITVDGEGRRLVNVGLLTRQPGASQPIANEVWSVHLPSRSIVLHAGGAPETSRANLLACGPPSASCSASVGSCASAWHIEWPADDPVWSMDAWHPKCTQAYQTDGTGLAVLNVKYRGRLVLARGDMPVLNVQYLNNECGPYRDWLWSENCFAATGTTVSPGVLVTDGTTPGTACETGSDAGNFKGMAIHDEGDALWLVSESDAGWYRYAMEWRFHLDGTIEPLMAFSAVSNSCVCSIHNHHAYWRFEWAPDGTTGNPSTGIATLERRRAGTTDTWDPVPAEAVFTRPVDKPEEDFFRLRNPATGFVWTIEPGHDDGSSSGDTYAKADFWALAENGSQVNDPNTNTTIAIDSWINGEALGTTKRLVTWYHAGFRHDVNALDEQGHYLAEGCHAGGPKLRTLGCAGLPSFDRTAFACGVPIGLRLGDSDLAGTGSVTVTVRSTSEATPEAIVLAETPAGSGNFAGSVTTTSAAPTPGDGLLTVASGDTVTVSYTDASACGTAGQVAEKSVAIDCAPPVLSAVAATNVTGSSARITWTTNEPASTLLFSGTTSPGATETAGADGVTAHQVDLTGLASCTTHWFRARSTDPAGNSSTADNGGPGFTFTTLANSGAAVASSPSPVAIPDNNANGASKVIAVSNPGVVTDLDVVVNVTHTWVGDLKLSLTTPWGASVPLVTNRGSSGDNFAQTRFDDEATNAVSSGGAPFTGSFRPESPLSVVDGQPAAGNWLLRAVDNAASDVGTIDLVTLDFTFVPVPCPTGAGAPPVPDGTTGSPFRLAKGAAGALSLSWDAATCASPGYHALSGLLGTASPLPDTALCSLSTSGSASWAAPPAGDRWFLLVGNDGTGQEGSWGTNSSGGPIGKATPSGFCGITRRENGSCP